MHRGHSIGCARHGAGRHRELGAYSILSSNLRASNSSAGIDQGGQHSIVVNNTCYNNGQTDHGPGICTGSVAYAQTLGNGISCSVAFGVAGAAMGDLVRVSHTADTKGCKVSGWVSSPGTVSFRIENNVGEQISIPAGTISVWVETSLNYADY